MTELKELRDLRAQAGQVYLEALSSLEACPPEDTHRRAALQGVLHGLHEVFTADWVNTWPEQPEVVARFQEWVGQE